jgi:hypothetical protein
MRPESAGPLITLVQYAAWAVFLGLWAQIMFWDVREQKIHHSHLRRGLAFSALVYLLLLSATLLGRLGYVSAFYRWPFYSDLFSYVAASALAALGMWRGGVWPAGDTKLFVLLSLLFPLLEVSGSFQGGWLFLFVLINIFIPASLAVFAQAARHVWLTRLRHRGGFAWQMGLRRGLDFALGKVRETLPEALRRFKAESLSVLRDPLVPLKAVGSWLVSIFIMSLASLLLKDVVSSALVRTLLCFAVILAWGRVNSAVARKLPAALLLAVAAGLVVSRFPGLWLEVRRSFGYMSVFGVFMYLGVRWTMGLVAGELVMWMLPLLGILGSLIPWGMSFAVPSFDMAWARGLLPLAGLGLFFGLSFVFVRIWDNEDHPDIPPEKLLSYMVLHHSFIERLREDEAFFEEHFSTSYADGLTREQAEALRGWAARNGVETVPLTTTMAFSHWIFFGYLLTWMMKGHILQKIY